MRDGEELVLEPFQRLIQKKQLMAYEHDGFYAAMDTFKDKQLLDDLYARGDAPWEVWKCAPPKGITVEPAPWKNSVPDSADYVGQVARF
jgi:NDP-sugar pyrophosphorylase family protein